MPTPTGCPKIKFTSCTRFYKEYKEQVITKIIMSMDARQHFWEILTNFLYLIFFLLHNILFGAVFCLFTGRKRITFICWYFKNFCQNDKNEKSYFAFDSVIKIVKSYIPPIIRRVTTRKWMNFTHWKFWLIIYTHKIGIWITQSLAKMNINFLHK